MAKADGPVCLLSLMVTGRMVSGKLEWHCDIVTKGMLSRMAAGADIRNYEPEMCCIGIEALQKHEQQVTEDLFARG
jgi:hypothetical protein